jgi:hypothetical protein
MNTRTRKVSALLVMAVLLPLSTTSCVSVNTSKGPCATQLENLKEPILAIKAEEVNQASASSPEEKLRILAKSGQLSSDLGVRAASQAPNCPDSAISSEIANFGRYATEEGQAKFDMISAASIGDTTAYNSAQARATTARDAANATTVKIQTLTSR